MPEMTVAQIAAAVQARGKADTDAFVQIASKEMCMAYGAFLAGGQNMLATVAGALTAASDVETPSV